MRIHALSTTTAASAIVATTLLTGGAAFADNNCPPPPINGSTGANTGANTGGVNAGTNGSADSGISGTAGPNADTNANGTTDANGSTGTGTTGANGTANNSADDAANGSAGANGTADGGAPMPPPQVAGSHGHRGAPATLLIDCGDRAEVKPGQYTLACNDGTNYLTDLNWTHWGTYSARGTGVQHANDCTPDCAHGTFHSYSVIVTVNHRKQLADYQGVSYFSRMRLDYGTVRPGELTHQDYTLTP